MDNLTIAIAKGRIEKDIYRRLKDLNMEKWIDRDSRKLIFTDEENYITYIHVKPSDVVTYVEKGVADLGIVGKDTILENENKSEVYEDLFDISARIIANRVSYKFNYDKIQKIIDLFDSTVKASDYK